MLTTTITPQLSDLDSFRHVNYMVVHRWFEAGRLPMYRRFAPDLAPERLRLVMVRLEVDYVAEMFAEDEVEIHTSVVRIGSSSFHILQEAHQSRKLCARGVVVLVHLDNDTKKPLPLPKEYRDYLETLVK